MTKIIDPKHERKRQVFRSLGITLLVTGVLLMIIGIGSFFVSFGSFDPPRFFWCAFLGIPILGVGIALTSYGYMGALSRYVAGESAPVAKDTFNYVAQETKDGIKTIASAIGGGLAEARTGAASNESVRCFKCNNINEIHARFCSQCGFALQKTKTCPFCRELNDPDAKFCDNCGKAL